MPEYKGNNIWKLLEGEYFIATDGEVVENKGLIVKVETFPETNLILIQGSDRKWEVNGPFESAVKQKKISSPQYPINEA